jgi:replicative DNA helicase
MQQDLEQRLLSLMVDQKVFDEATSFGIDSASFVMFADVFDYIQKYYYKYNSLPAKAVVSSIFPGFSYLDDVKDHETKYLCDELIKAKVKRDAITIINNASDSLTVDPYGTIDSVIYRLSNIKKGTPDAVHYTDGDAIARYTKVVANRDKTAKGISVGIKTGISFLDDKYLGWQVGSLIGIVGRTGVGKSWIAEYLSCQAYLSGKRVLFLSPELSCDQVNFRWDTIMSRFDGRTFLNDKLLIGQINLKEYNEWLTKMSTRKDWITLDTASGRSFNIGSITALVNKFSPDVLVVDGVALIEAPGEKSWEKVMTVSYGLKAISVNKKLVTIATSQANRETGDEMPKTHQVSYGDAFAQAVDDLIMLQQDRSRPDIRYATIPKRRNGEPINSLITIKFDVNNGLLSM